MKSRIRSLAFAMVTLVVCAHAVLAGSDNGRFDIYWVDVEGGAATLMVTPRGESVLIDSGNPGHRDPDRIVKVATEVAGLTRIDYLITTHYHRDHYGGAATLATLIPIGTVFDNGIFDQMPDNPGAAYFDIDDIADETNPLPHMSPSADKFADRVGKLGVAQGGLPGMGPRGLPPGMGRLGR